MRSAPHPVFFLQRVRKRLKRKGLYFTKSKRVQKSEARELKLLKTNEVTAEAGVDDRTETKLFGMRELEDDLPDSAAASIRRANMQRSPAPSTML